MVNLSRASGFRQSQELDERFSSRRGGLLWWTDVRKALWSRRTQLGLFPVSASAASWRPTQTIVIPVVRPTVDNATPPNRSNSLLWTPPTRSCCTVVNSSMFASRLEGVGSGVTIASSLPRCAHSSPPSQVLPGPAVMPRINVPPAMMAEVKEAMTSTSEKILRLRLVGRYVLGTR